MRNIAAKYEFLFGEDLIKRIEEIVAGNFKQALVSWFNENAVDNFKEEAISRIIIERFGSMGAAMNDPDTVQTIRSELTSEKEVLVSYNESQQDKNGGGNLSPSAALPPVTKLSLPPIHAETRGNKNAIAAAAMNATDEEEAEEKPSSAPAAPVRLSITIPKSEAKNLDIVESKPSSEQNTSEVAASIKTPVTPGSRGNGAARLISMKSPSIRAIAIDNNETDFDRKWFAVCEFLSQSFKLFDRDRSGYLESAEFWNALRSFNLGYTEDEIGGFCFSYSYCDFIFLRNRSFINVIFYHRNGSVDRLGLRWLYFLPRSSE